MKSLATSLLTGAAVIMAAATFLPDEAAAQRQRPPRVGTLTCNVSPSVGMIIGSQRSLRCTFTSSRGGRREAYSGSVTRLGLDVGATAGGRMVWAVYAPTTAGRGALAGTYAGASGEISAGAGVGANVLVGGSNRTVTLQPLSVQAQAGVNLAVGVAGLTLNPG
jgi:hypothetical protein